MKWAYTDRLLFIPWLEYRLLNAVGCWDDEMMTLGVAWKAVQRLMSSVRRIDDDVSPALWLSSCWRSSRLVASSLPLASLLPAPRLQRPSSPHAVVGWSGRPSASTTTSRSSSTSSSSCRASPRTLRMLNDCHLAVSAAPVWTGCWSAARSNIELFYFDDFFKDARRRFSLQPPQLKSVLCDVKSPPTEQQLAERRLPVIAQIVASSYRSRITTAPAGLFALTARRCPSPAPSLTAGQLFTYTRDIASPQTNIISVLTGDQSLVKMSYFEAPAWNRPRRGFWITFLLTLWSHARPRQ